jgi:hypothetical protein
MEGTPTQPPEPPAQPPPTPPPAPPAPPQEGPAKVHVGLRIFAIIVALILIPFSIGITQSASDNLGYETCSSLKAHPADITLDTTCFDGSSFQKYVGSGIGLIGVAFAALAVFAAFYMLFTGRNGRLFLFALAGCVVFMGLGALIIHA